MAFSKNVSSSTDNIGYIIPFPIVEHFLSEYRARGVYQGVVSPGFYTQPMENPAQQQYLQVSQSGSQKVGLHCVVAHCGLAVRRRLNSRKALNRASLYLHA